MNSRPHSPYPGYHDDHRGMLTRGQAIVLGILATPVLWALCAIAFTILEELTCSKC